jgi:hypothetical protein
MVFDKINQSRCINRSVKRSQKSPKVVNAGHDLTQPAMTFAAPFCECYGTKVERKLFIRSCGFRITNKALDAGVVLSHLLAPALHCLVGEPICSERILLRGDFVHDILYGVSYMMLVRAKIPRKLSMQFSTFGTFKAADHAMIGLSAFSAAEPAALVSRLQECAAARAVLVFVITLNRENLINRIENNSLV